MAQEIEIIKLVGSLAIGLMSITIPIYTLSVPWFRSEYSKARKTIRKRRSQIQSQLDKGKIKNIEEAEEKIKSLRKLEKQASSWIAPLSFKATVLIPFIAFSLALFFIMRGLHVYPDLYLDSIAYALIFIVVGVSYWFLCLNRVEQIIKEAAAEEEK